MQNLSAIEPDMIPVSYKELMCLPEFHHVSLNTVKKKLVTIREHFRLERHERLYVPQLAAYYKVPTATIIKYL